MSKVDVPLISALTGLVGTIGGTLIAYLTLKHSLNQDKHRIKVELGKNIMVGVKGVDRKDEQFTILVANLGKVPFRVANVGINIGRRSGGLVLPKPFGTHELPVLLIRDQTCNFWTSYEDSAKSINKLTKRNKVRVRASISDYTGRRFYSDWMKIRFKETIFSRIEQKIGVIKRSMLKFIRP